MPEHRGRKHHQDRVAETLREEIGAMIEGELSDPRIAFCHVSEVVLNPGGKSARVYVALDSAVPDIAKAEADTVAGLEAAKGMGDFVDDTVDEFVEVENRGDSLRSFLYPLQVIDEIGGHSANGNNLVAGGVWNRSHEH